MPRLFALFFGAVVRWGVTLVAGWFIGHGVISKELGDELVFGLMLSIPPLLWALWQKYKSRLGFLTALQLPAQASEDDVKVILKNTTQGEKMAVVAGKSLSQLMLCFVLLPLLLILQGCPFATNPQQAARSAEEQFAAYTDRIAEYVGRGMKFTEFLVDTQTIQPTVGASVNNILISINASDKQLIQASQKFIVVVDGKRVLRFTEDGRLELEKLADALATAATNVIKDPALVNIDPKARSQLLEILTPLQASAKSLLRLIQRAKTVTNGQTIEIELSYERYSIEDRGDHRLRLATI